MIVVGDGVGLPAGTLAYEDVLKGVDDKVFRLDRTKLDECTSLIADRKELAAMRHK